MSKRHQFSIQALFAAIFVAAVIVSTFDWIGHYLIFAAPVILCLVSGWRLLNRPANWRARLLLVSGTILFGFAAYILSIGPASRLLARYDTCDTPRPGTETFYSRLYIPIATRIIYAPAPVRRAGMWYVAKWMPAGVEFHADWPDGMGWSSWSARDPGKGWTYTVVHY